MSENTQPVQPNHLAIIGNLYCKLLVKETELAQSAEFIKQFEAKAGEKFAALQAELATLKAPKETA